MINIQRPIHTKNRTIGLLGGSFNPAHSGHLHISLHALKKLGLDEVWWLVSPKNPLKSASSLASYGDRLASARVVASVDRRIKVLDIEAKFKTRYSYQTIALLKRRFAGAHFVWMFGADNLASFHRWKRWEQVLATIPIVVFDRAPYSHTSIRSKAMLRMRRFLRNNAVSPSPVGEGRGGGEGHYGDRIIENKQYCNSNPKSPPPNLPSNRGGIMKAPCFIFEHLKRDPISSTYLRKTLGQGAFLRHNKNAGTL